VAARVDHEVAVADLDGAGHDHVEVALVAALVGQGRAGADLLLGGQVGDTRKNGPINACKQRRPFEQGDLVAHGWSSALGLFRSVVGHVTVAASRRPRDNGNR
jgi:hypothetical protein